MGMPSRPALFSVLAILSLTLLIPAQRGGLDLSGRVLDPAGEPIPFAEVFAQPNKIRSCGGQGFCLYGYQDLAIGWSCPPPEEVITTKPGSSSVSAPRP